MGISQSLKNLGRLSALWTVCFLWPRVARFVFNLYRHQSLCIVRSSSKELIIIKSREGVSQGCPMSMDMYGVALVPLGKMVREAE